MGWINVLARFLSAIGNSFDLICQGVASLNEATTIKLIHGLKVVAVAVVAKAVWSMAVKLCFEKLD